jgi:signal transduction histidine kinase
MGGLAIVATGLCGVWIAHRISLTANQISRHVRRIAQGDFRPFPVPLQQDELGDLVRDINTMAEQLKLYEAKIRRTEQEKILEQLGSGLAHEIRNAVTGARMALQIHAGECPLEECESLAIATRQLQIMENQLQRYLQLSRTQETIDPKSVDLTAMLEHLLPLMRPLAEHLLVVLAWDRPAEPIHAMANREALEQVILNLLQNGIEAAAAQSYPASAERQVQLSLQQTAASAVRITVTDSGAGPSPAVRDRLFEKFATDKLHGTGLGLSVSRDIVQQHDGTLTWKRDGDRTVFTVQLPGLPQEVLDVENSCR